MILFDWLNLKPVEQPKKQDRVSWLVVLHMKTQILVYLYLKEMREKFLSTAFQGAPLKQSALQSVEGKAVVAKNALKHGIFSKQILLEGESKKDFESFKNEFYTQFSPEGFLEQLLCERALSAAWRLSRVTQMETLLIDHTAKKTYSNRSISEVLSGRHGDELMLLSRYEITLEKILFRSLGELKSLQMARSLEQAIPITEIGFVPQKIIDLSI